VRLPAENAVVHHWLVMPTQKYHAAAENQDGRKNYAGSQQVAHDRIDLLVGAQRC